MSYMGVLLKHAAKHGRTPKRPSFLTLNTWAAAFFRTSSNRPTVSPDAAAAESAHADHEIIEFKVAIANVSFPQPGGGSHVAVAAKFDAEFTVAPAEDEAIANDADALQLYVFDPGGILDAGSLWSNCKASTTAYFLIPLRGSKCNQWNDEVEDEEEAAIKKKIKRRMMMRHKYLRKDLLDPG